MKNTTTAPLLLLAALFILSTFNLLAQSSLNQDAKSIQRSAYEIKSEIQSHYTSNSAYHHISSHIDEIIADTNRLESLTRNNSIESNQLVGHLDKLKSAVNHIGELVRDVNRGNYGRIDYELGHVVTKIDTLGISIDRLRRSATNQNVHTNTCGHDHNHSNYPIVRAPQYTPPVLNPPTKPDKPKSTWERFLKWLGLS